MIVDMADDEATTDPVQVIAVGIGSHAIDPVIMMAIFRILSNTLVDDVACYRVVPVLNRCTSPSLVVTMALYGPSSS